MTFEIFDLHAYKGSAISLATESEKPKAPAPKEEDENKKSFYQRNKAAIAAISAVAIAGITLAVHHHIKVKNLSQINLSIMLSKAEILEFLEKDKDFEDIVKQLKSSKIDKELVMNLKRRVTMKYHPDRILTKTPQEKAMVTAKFQKIFGAIEMLEKGISN